MVRNNGNKTPRSKQKAGKETNGMNTIKKYTIENKKKEHDGSKTGSSPPAKKGKNNKDLPMVIEYTQESEKKKEEEISETEEIDDEEEEEEKQVTYIVGWCLFLHQQMAYKELMRIWERKLGFNVLILYKKIPGTKEQKKETRKAAVIEVASENAAKAKAAMREAYKKGREEWPALLRFLLLSVPDQVFTHEASNKV